MGPKERSQRRAIDRRYRLSVETAGYTPHVEVVEVEAGPDRDGLELALAPTEGLDLVVLLPSGRAPARASVSVLDPAGRPMLAQTRSVSDTGRVRFPTVPTGTWDLIVSAPGGATTRARATVPGPPVELLLAPADRLVVRVPELASANLVASLSLDGLDGRPFESIGSAGAPQREWRLDGGTETSRECRPGSGHFASSLPTDATGNRPSPPRAAGESRWS